MNEYTIEICVPRMHNLQQMLQSAYDDVVAGSFTLVALEENTKIVFDRGYYDDAEMIEARLARGATLQQAVSDQLADEFELFDKDKLSSVINALRTQAVAYDKNRIPLTAYIGFFKSNENHPVPHQC